MIMRLKASGAYVVAAMRTALERIPKVHVGVLNASVSGEDGPACVAQNALAPKALHCALKGETHQR